MKEYLTFSESQITQSADFIYNKAGLVYKEDKKRELIEALEKTAKHFAIDEFSKLFFKISQIHQTQEYSYLINQLTINETFFFRHFNALEKVILPKLVRDSNTKNLSIWSAGCSSGEEPYTIAMVLRNLIGADPSFKISIQASDIDHKMIELADRGIYKKWSMRQISSYYLNNYFIKHKDESYEIKPEIKKMAQFRIHNLMENDYPSHLNNTNDLDMILCRNVTIYFDQIRTQQIISKFNKCLKEGGYLIVGHSEPSPFLFEQFEHQIIEDMVVYKKPMANAVKQIYQVKFNPDFFKSAPPKKIISPAPINTTPSKLVAQTEQIKPVVKTDMRLSGVNELFRKANDSYKNLEYSDALIEIKEILEQNSTFLPALYLHALIHANIHEFDTAIFSCQKMISIDSLYINAYYLLCLIYKEKKEFKLSIENAKKAIYINHEFILAYYELIHIYVLIEDLSSAEKHYMILKKVLSHLKDDENIGIKLVDIGVD